MENEKKSLMRETVNMAWPSVLESVFVVFAGMVDTYMIAPMGQYAVAAVGLTGQPKYFTLSVFFSVNIAISALVARRKGEQKREQANALFLTGFMYVLVLGALLSILCVVFAENIIVFCGGNSDTTAAAVSYFRIIMGCMMFNIISLYINAAQKGSGRTKIAMYTNVTSNIVNIFCNYLLIDGHLGFPALGIQGAAIATVIGTVIACFMSIISVFKKDSYIYLPYIIKEHIRPAMEEITVLAKMGLNFLGEMLMTRVGFMATAILTAKLGTDPYAAHQVGMNFLNIGFAFGDGMQIAAVALVGRSLGEKNIDKAKEYAKITQKVGLVISLCLSAVFAFLGKPLFGLFFKQEHMMAMGVMICIFIAVIMPIQICKIINSGVLRGAGDVKFTLFQSVFSITLVQPLSTWLLMMYLKLGLTGVWGSILLTQFLQCVLLGGRYLSNKWTTKKI